MGIPKKETKKCSECGEIKNLDEFYTQNKYSKTRGEWIYYNPECKVCTKNRASKRQKENREEITENLRDYFKNYFKNPDRKLKHREVLKKRREQGKEIQWQRENKDKLKKYAEKRQHKQHEISENEWENCKKYFNHRCAYCELKIEEHYNTYKGMTKLGDFHKEHVDHEGANDLSNCVPSCKSCNGSKHDFDLNDWYNDSNPNYTKGRLEKIIKWLNTDYKQFIKNK